MTEQLSAAIDHLFELKEMDNILEKMEYYYSIDEDSNELLYRVLTYAAGNPSFGEINDTIREDIVATLTRLILLKDEIAKVFGAHLEKHWSCGKRQRAS